ncbi:MAG TPA: VOC family protein [Burkholderiales bacterium]|nr:VOC family protein [Burkholderiales bacterium]
MKPVPDGYHSITPYLICGGAAKAIEFYKKGFRRGGNLAPGRPRRKDWPRRVKIGDSIVMLADEHPEMGARGPRTIGGSPVSILLYVNDVDAVYARAVGADAKAQRPVSNQFYGDRAGSVEDPFGHTWHIHTHVEDLTPEEIA